MAIFNGQADTVSDIVWLTPTQVLSVGRDSCLRLQTLSQAYRPYQHLSTSAIGWSPKNELGTIYEQINRNDMGEE